MGTSAVIQATYLSVEKPFELIERSAHCGGTDYFKICMLDDDQARLLAAEGIQWFLGEPDWGEHYRKIEKMKAQKQLHQAQKRLDELASQEHQ